MAFKNKSMSFALLGALLALASCRDLALDPVFYTLSKEQPLSDDLGMPDGATVHRMVELGTRYFAAANTLYTRTDGPSDTWTVITPPANAGLCNGLEAFSGSLYASFATGTGVGLYRLTPPDLVAWTKIDDLGAGSYAQVTMLKTTSLGTATLFVATWDETLSQYALSYSTSGDSGSYTVVSGGDWPVPASSKLSIIDVASDGNYYWVIVGNSLFRDDAGAGVGTFSLLSPQPPSSGTSYYGGLLYDSSVPRLYLSAGNGYLHSSADGDAPWTTSAVQRDAENKNVLVHFTSWALPGSDNSPTGTVYVGTQGQGYYRVPGGDVAGTLIRKPSSYSITALYRGALNSFFYDSANARFFICTNGSGLWRGSDFAASIAEWTWKQE